MDYTVSELPGSTRLQRNQDFNTEQSAACHVRDEQWINSNSSYLSL